MLNCQKDKFDLEPHIHYLNGAYMSPTSARVAAAGVMAIGRKQRPYQISPNDFFTEVARIKTLYARLVNAESAQHVALIPSASYGIATVAKNLKVSMGQEILVTESQFPSNMYSWRRLAKEKGVNLKVVSYPIHLTENRGSTWQHQILESINNQTAIVAMGHVHWANGTKFDLAAIGRRCREVGAKLIIDGTQSVGALPIDVQAMGIDALVTAGYKWLMGPYSLGYAYYSDAFNEGVPLEENWISRKFSEDFRGLVDYQDDYQPQATRYDVGEKSNFTLVPMGIEALSQLLEWGIGNIQSYCYELTKNYVEIWKNHGFWVEKDEWRGHHLFGIQLPQGLDLDKLTDTLRDQNIFVSVRGDFMRISPNVYNDEADLQVLTSVLVSATG